MSISDWIRAALGIHEDNRDGRLTDYSGGNHRLVETISLARKHT